MLRKLNWPNISFGNDMSSSLSPPSPIYISVLLSSSSSSFLQIKTLFFSSFCFLWLIFLRLLVVSWCFIYWLINLMHHKEMKLPAWSDRLLMLNKTISLKLMIRLSGSFICWWEHTSKPQTCFIRVHQGGRELDNEEVIYSD